MKISPVATFLIICGFALATASHHYDDDHETKYFVITKHEVAPHHDWNDKHLTSYGNKHLGYKIDAAKYSDYHGDHKYDHDDSKDAKYEFDYGVKDLKTGDIKNQHEHRDGDHVKGVYSLKEADGTIRVVEYSADDHNGFNAVVKKIGHAEHPVVQTKSVHHAKWNSDHGLAGFGHMNHDHDSHNNGYAVLGHSDDSHKVISHVSHGKGDNDHHSHGHGVYGHASHGHGAYDHRSHGHGAYDHGSHGLDSHDHVVSYVNIKHPVGHVKSAYHAKWESANEGGHEGHYGHTSYDHDYDHGHAASYVNIKQH